MINRITCLSLSLLFCVSASGHAKDWGGKNGSNSGNNVLNGAGLAGSRQGLSVGIADIDGDGIDDKIVGAPYASSSSNTGAVLVYKGDAVEGFSSSPYLLLAGDDNYGYSFANVGDVSGDGKDDFAVGAINGNGEETSLSGSVTIYKGGRNWNYNEGDGKIIAKLGGEGPMDKFGISIASEDLNADGKRDLIVGAPFNTSDPAIYQGGAVYVFFAPDFTSRQALHASPMNKGLGWSAAAGDINGDGIADLCISATGKVLCYYGSQNFDASIDAPDVTIRCAGSGFGKALSVTGDLNRDGFGEIAIGAPNAVVNGNRDTGSVYVVKGGAGKRAVNLDAPSSDLIIRIDGEDLFHRFGSSIASIDNISGTRPGFAVGAPMADASPFIRLSGKVYFFSEEDISSESTLASSAVFGRSGRDQGYGAALAAAQNNSLLIGAPRTDMDTGAVFMVDITTGQEMPEGSSGGPMGESGGCQ